MVQIVKEVSQQNSFQIDQQWVTKATRSTQLAMFKYMKNTLAPDLWACTSRGGVIQTTQM